MNEEIHTPTRIEIPTEDDLGVDRQKIPHPGPWQDGVRAKSKKTGEVVWVRRVDTDTRQFRIVGEPRTKWHSFEDFDPIVEKSPADIAREKATAELAEELAKLTPEQAAMVQVLADDADPVKGLAKLRALKGIGALTPVTSSAAPEKPKGGKP
ncbi:MAG TPA: hypothetical protein VEA38_15070 [Terriglobales bacterium]|nr:hypothetical protein [Terriglobales bacterium]